MEHKRKASEDINEECDGAGSADRFSPSWPRHEQLRAIVHRTQYRWYVQESAGDPWHLLEKPYSMRQMSRMVRDGKYVDIDIIDAVKTVEEQPLLR